MEKNELVSVAESDNADLPWSRPAAGISQSVNIILLSLTRTFYRGKLDCTAQCTRDLFQCDCRAYCTKVDQLVSSAVLNRTGKNRVAVSNAEITMAIQVGRIGVARIFDWGSCKFSPLTSFTLDDISHS